MGMTVRISTELLQAVVALAKEGGSKEVCGLIFASTGAITGFEPATNVAADPETRFEIDPAALLRAHREQREGRRRIIGCYHSHPSGAPEPSACDAAEAAPDGWLWLIIGCAEARLWRSVADGAVHGRFDPVPLACIDPPHSPESALSP